MNYKTYKQAEKVRKEIFTSGELFAGVLNRTISVECPKCHKLSYSFDEEFAYEPSEYRCPWCSILDLDEYCKWKIEIEYEKKAPLYMHHGSCTNSFCKERFGKDDLCKICPIYNRKK